MVLRLKSLPDGLVTFGIFMYDVRFTVWGDWDGAQRFKWYYTGDWGNM